MGKSTRPRLTLTLDVHNLTVDDLRYFAELAARHFSPGVPVHFIPLDDEGLIQVSGERHTHPDDQ